MSAKQLMLRELEARELIRTEIFAPPLISSIGAHMFNLVNLSREEGDHPSDAILYVQGKPFNTRLHVMFLAPPGFMKTTMLEHFLRGRQSLLKKSCIDCQWEGFMTEAGFVGTVKEIEGGMAINKPGVALKHQNSIIGMEEFAILTSIMKSGAYGGTLVDQLLTALDSGYVGKSLGPGSLKYRTNATIWPGTQIQRFELGAGLPRRFVFMIWFPTKLDQGDLKDAWFKGFNIKWRPSETKKIASVVNSLSRKIEKLEEGSVTYTDEFKEFIKATGSPHYEFPLFIRLILGDMIMSGDFTENGIKLNLKSGRAEMIMQQLRWREQIRYDTQQAQVRSILRYNDNSMKKGELLSELTILGIDKIDGIKIIDQMIKLKILSRSGAVVTIPVEESWRGK